MYFMFVWSDDVVDWPFLLLLVEFFAFLCNSTTCVTITAARHSSVSNAAQWEQEYNPSGNSAGYNPTGAAMGFNFNDCKTVSTNKTTERDSMTTGYGKDSGGASWKPNAATLATLHEQQQKLQSCQSGYIQQAMNKYSNMPVTKKVLEQGGANGMYVTSKEGILGQVRLLLIFFFSSRYFGAKKSDTFSYDFHTTFISLHLSSYPFIFSLSALAVH